MQTTTNIERMSRKLGVNINAESATLKEIKDALEEEKNKISNLISETSARVAAQSEAISKLPNQFSLEIENINNQLDYLSDSAPAFTDQTPSSSISEGEPNKMALDNGNFYVCGTDKVWRKIPLQNF